MCNNFGKCSTISRCEREWDRTSTNKKRSIDSIQMMLIESPVNNLSISCSGRKPNTLRIGFLHIQSIFNKVVGLEGEVHEITPDIHSLAETWLNNKTKQSFKIDGYHVIMGSSMTNSNGSGVAKLIKTNVNVVFYPLEVNMMMGGVFESCACMFVTDTYKFVLLVVSPTENSRLCWCSIS